MFKWNSGQKATKALFAIEYESKLRVAVHHYSPACWVDTSVKVTLQPIEN